MLLGWPIMRPCFAACAGILTCLTFLLSSCADPDPRAKYSAYERVNQRDAFHQNAERASMETFSRGPEFGGSSYQPIDQSTLMGLFGRSQPSR